MKKNLIVAASIVVTTAFLAMVIRNRDGSQTIFSEAHSRFNSNSDNRRLNLDSEVKRRKERELKELNPIKSFTQLGEIGLSPEDFDLERHRLMLLIAQNEGYDVAMQVLDAQVGDGIARRALIATIFKGLKEGVSVSLNRIDNIPPSDAKYAMRGLAERIDYQKLPDSDMATLFSSEQAKEDYSPLTAAIGVGFMNAEGSEVATRFDRIASVFSQLPREDKGNFLATALYAASRTYPFEAWKYLTSLDLSDIPENEKIIKCKASIIASMIAADPPKALETIHQDKLSPSNAFFDAISDLYLVDSKKADLWIEEHLGSFTDIQKDQITSARIGSMLQSDKLPEAEKAIDEIKDVRIKDEANSELFKVEKKKLLTLAKTDPSGAMGQLINTESSRSGLLIMEVMSAWISKDSVQAGDWCSKNWNALPAGKAQFFAAAYVKESLAKGDTSTAQKWASNITDQTLREAFDAEIRKATK